MHAIDVNLIFSAFGVMFNTVSCISELILLVLKYADIQTILVI